VYWSGLCELKLSQLSSIHSFIHSLFILFTSLLVKPQNHMEFICTANAKLSFKHIFCHLLHFYFRNLLPQFKMTLSTLKLMYLVEEVIDDLSTC
jgi:hypothetical protein